MVADEKSAGAVIYFNSEEGPEPRFLLLHYTSGHWDFPKGNIERGESETQTVVRETREETGISDIELLSGFRETVEYRYRHGKRLVNKEVVLFLARTRTDNVVLSHEHIGFAWLRYDAALKQLTFKNAKRVLEAAMKVLSR